MKHRWLMAVALALLVLAGAGGCAALAPVRGAQDFEVLAWTNYVRGVAKIDRLQGDLYRVERDAALEAATARALGLLGAKEQITGAEAAAGAKLIIELREGIQAQTRGVLASVQVLVVQNRRSATQGFKVGSLLREYMNSGVDEGEVRPYIDAAIAAIRAKFAESDIDLPSLPE